MHGTQVNTVRCVLSGRQPPCSVADPIGCCLGRLHFAVRKSALDAQHDRRAHHWPWIEQFGQVQARVGVVSIKAMVFSSEDTTA